MYSYPTVLSIVLRVIWAACSVLLFFAMNILTVLEPVSLQDIYPGKNLLGLDENIADKGCCTPLPSTE